MKMKTQKLMARMVAGFTLIEMMIALFVLSVGMLGVVSLQTLSIRSSQEASHETTASILAASMLENMRATPRTNWNDFKTTAQSTTPACVNTGGVSVSEQVNCFHNLVMTSLPQGSASITVDASGSYSIAIGWGEGGTSSTQVWRP